MIADPSIARVAADLEQSDFLRGCDAGRWRIISYEFPILNFAISATEPDGTASEYGFQAELSNYPGQAPKVRIWDLEKNASLEPERRPKGGARIEKNLPGIGARILSTARGIGRPAHTATTRPTYPHLAWNPERHLVFIFEDLLWHP